MDCIVLYSMYALGVVRSFKIKNVSLASGDMYSVLSWITKTPRIQLDAKLASLPF